MSVTIRIHKPDTSTQWMNLPMRAEFFGTKATVNEALVEFDGEKLRASGTDNNRRFVPADLAWWLEFMEEDAPEYIDVQVDLSE